MDISIELVPRNDESLKNDIKKIQAYLSNVSAINIPDLIRFKMRSWSACPVIKPYFSRVIPHLRAMDIDKSKPLPMVNTLKNSAVENVLIIGGDRPHDFSRRIFPSSTIDIIRKFKQELPDIHIYAGMDPYRGNFREELEYMERKLEVGACGFFTQPFFDIRLLEVFAELYRGVEVFWGVTPVLSKKSKGFWESKNNAIFPDEFKPTLDWNRKFAERALECVSKYDSNIYFMPIRLDVAKYLQNII